MLLLYILKYGGNPVSCAIANAVMNVIESEKLQENALKVGNYLLEKCIALKRDFDIVGDVRGWGLFVGLEIVENKETRSPATKEAQWIVDRMKNVHHVLISSDGPDDNVLKLKPPMLFNKENADEFLAAIAECLNTLQLQEVGILYCLFKKKIIVFSFSYFESKNFFFRLQIKQHSVAASNGSLQCSLSSLKIQEQKNIPIKTL